MPAEIKAEYVDVPSLDVTVSLRFSSSRAKNASTAVDGSVTLGGEGLAQRGMGKTGAALLAASAALHAGAGRVLVSLLEHVRPRAVETPAR